MVCPAMEEDAGEGVEGEEKYDFNMEYIKNIGDIMIKAGAVRPCLQFKITAMAPADLGRIPQILLKDIFTGLFWRCSAKKIVQLVSQCHHPTFFPDSETVLS